MCVPPEELQALAATYGTPFYLFDGDTMRKSIAALRDAFPSDIDYYVPAAYCGRRGLLRFLREQGIGVSCCSEEELQRAVECGFSGRLLRYAALTLREDTARLLRNLDASLTILSPLAIPRCVPRRVELRCHLPNFSKPHLGAANVRHDPLGLTPEEIAVTLEPLCRMGAESLGLSMPQGRNVLEERFYADKLDALMEVRSEILTMSDGTLSTADLGNGFGVEYRRLHPQPDMQKAGALLKERVEQTPGIRGLALSPWQYLLEPASILVGRVEGTLKRGEDMVITDISPAHTQITYPVRTRYVSISGKAKVVGRVYCSVMGARGEAAQWLGRKLILPPAENGDLLVFHDAGCCLPAGHVTCLLREADGTVSRL